MKKNGKWREGSPPPGAGEGAWGSGLRNLAEQAPDEAGELTSQSNHDFGFDHPALQKEPAAFVESDLGLPAEFTVRGGLALLAQGELGGDLGRAQGVLGGNLNWGLIGLGAAIGAAVIVIDEVLRKSGRGSLPPLAVGMGIYLPMGLTLLIPIGAICGHLYDKWAARQADPAFAERMGVLAATGLIVGESLFGVAFAGIAGASGDAEVLAVVKENAWAAPLGMAVFAGAVWWLYARTRAAVSSN